MIIGQNTRDAFDRMRSEIDLASFEWSINNEVILQMEKVSILYSEIAKAHNPVIQEIWFAQKLA